MSDDDAKKMVADLKERLRNTPDDQWGKQNLAYGGVNSIKPIETLYKGYRFRSRLEARWAVFFDVLGIKWEYECQGFSLPSGRWYLPDFWLPQLSSWVEIKPEKGGQPFADTSSVEYEFLVSRPILRPNEYAYIIFGTPGLPLPYDDMTPYAACIGGDSPYFWCECPYCGSIGMQFDGRSARNHHAPGCIAKTIGNGDKNYCMDSPRLMEAYQAARSARFEHGETP